MNIALSLCRTFRVLLFLALFLTSYMQVEAQVGEGTDAQWQSLYLRACEKFYAQDYNGATIDLSEVIRHRPSWYRAYTLRASCFANRNLVSRAFEDLERAGRIDSSAWNAWWIRGYLYLANHDYENAQTQLKWVEIMKRAGMPQYPVDEEALVHPKLRSR